MSGLAGICYLDGRNVEPPALEAMAHALTHRGPDGSGLWSDGPVGFVHLMLWTTPESLTEKLPFFDPASQLAITADARVDNRDDLLTTLDLVQPVSDSELILAAYRKWGEDCPEKLVGDFTFAIWDKRKRTLFVARDRIGVKPFYYHYKDDREFVFASEISPLFGAAGLERRPDKDAMRAFLAGLSPPLDGTLFVGVRRLPPATTFVIKNGRVTARKYWEPVSGRVRRPQSLDEHAEEFQYLFSQAVHAQMRSAFPIGCLLSGGLDSSSVLCQASRLIGKKTALSAYSLIFDQVPCDERSFIKEIIQHVDVEWLSAVVDAHEFDCGELLRNYYRVSPEWPVRGLHPSSYWPIFDLARGRGVRVMLTGYGGDHVVYGSFNYLADLLRSLRWGALLRELVRYRFSSLLILNYVLKPSCPDRLREPIKRVRGLFNKQSKRLATSVPSAWIEQGISHNEFSTRAAWEEAGYLVGPSNSHWLDGYLEPLAGRSKMELRHPFFDIRLVEFLHSLPSEEKLWGGRTKIILRHAMRGILPEMIRERRSKIEFSPAILFVLGNTFVDPGALKLSQLGFIDVETIRELVGSGCSSSSGEAKGLAERMFRVKLWRVICLENWCLRQLS